MSMSALSASFFNRTVTYLSARSKFDSALKNAGQRRDLLSWKKLADRADIDMLSHPEQDVLAKMWDAGDDIEKIRHTYAQGIVDDTQFMYMPPERARALQTLGGRMAFG